MNKKAKLKIFVIFSFLLIISLFFVIADETNLITTTIGNITKVYNTTDKIFTIYDKGVNIVNFTLLQNTYTCDKYCYANISGISTTDIFLFDNISLYDKDMNTRTINNYTITIRDGKGKIISEKVKFKGEFNIFIEGWKTEKIDLDWIIDVVGINLSEWATWLSPQKVYDEIDDGWINDSLWTNYSSGGADANNYANTSENTLTLTSKVYTNGGGYQSGHETNNLPVLDAIQNVTIGVTFDTTGGQCYSGSVWNGYLKMMGTYFFNPNKRSDQLNCDDGQSISDTSEWTFVRNGTGNYFDVYNDGAYNSTIIASDNVFKLYFFGGSGGIGGINNIYGSFGYVYYTEKDELFSNLSSPSNNSIEAVVPVNLICNQSSTAGRLVNSTLHIWNATSLSQLATNTTNISGFSNSTTFSTNLTNGTYIWNCLVFNNGGVSTFDDNNRTFRIDTGFPDIVINSISITQGSQTISFNATITDTTLDKCKYSIYNSSGMIDGTNQNISMDCNSNPHSATTTITPPHTFTLRVYANDTGGNENFKELNFTTTAVSPTIIGGGGGSTTTSSKELATNFTITSTNLLNVIDNGLAKDSVKPRTKQFLLTNKGIDSITLEISCDTEGANQSTKDINICDYVYFSETTFQVPPNEQERILGSVSVLTPENSSIGDVYYFNILAVSKEEDSEKYSKLSVSNRVTFLSYVYKWSYLPQFKEADKIMYPVGSVAFFISFLIFLLIFLSLNKMDMPLTGFLGGIFISTGIFISWLILF